MRSSATDSAIPSVSVSSASPRRGRGGRRRQRRSPRAPAPRPESPRVEEVRPRDGAGSGAKSAMRVRKPPATPPMLASAARTRSFRGRRRPGRTRDEFSGGRVDERLRRATPPPTHPPRVVATRTVREEVLTEVGGAVLTVANFGHHPSRGEFRVGVAARLLRREEIDDVRAGDCAAQEGRSARTRPDGSISPSRTGERVAR